MNVLFLCTGNSARSILAEVLLNQLGQGAYTAFSAGSHPAGEVNPGALQKLAAEGYPTDELASKSWDVFSGNTAPEIDIVITVCDTAAGESCPVWNGSPITVHWGIPDPAYFNEDDARRAAFDLTYGRLKFRITAMLELSLTELSAADAQRALQLVHERAPDFEISDA